MNTSTAVLGLFLTATLAAACVGTPGAQPHDMSAAGHERAAEAAEADAARHGGHYDAGATTTRTRCSRQSAQDSDPCWSTDANPTKEHLAEAERMRKAAADHRAASQALRDAEAAACAGLPEAERDTSPLQHPGDVTGVEEASVSMSPSKIGGRQVVGAEIALRAVSGLTKEYLQRLVSCHVARNSSMGHSMPEMATCPLAVKGARATVESGNAGFVVRVTSNDDAAIAEILRRARALKSSAAQ